MLPEIGTQFAQLVDAQRGSAGAEITSAFPMSNADIESLVAALEKKFAIKLRPSVTVDQDLIGRISNEALREAESANVVAANIQHIFAVTEQTSEGTRSTAQMVRELSRTAEELKASVARFKIS